MERGEGNRSEWLDEIDELDRVANGVTVPANAEAAPAGAADLSVLSHGDLVDMLAKELES